MAFIRGTSRPDRLIGTDDSDFILAFADDDVVNAGAGNDYVDAGLGNDLVDGGDGNDMLIGGLGNDVLEGGRGDDVLTDSLAAGGPPHSVERLSDDDVMNGGDGDDVLISAMGNDVMAGGDGNDTFVIAGPGVKVIIGGEGDDSAGPVHPYYQPGDPSGPADLRGVWSGSFLGGAGNDVFTGGPNDDFVDGGAGNDTLTGGGGADLFIFEAPSDGVDVLTDFTPGVDEIAVSGSTFGGGLVFPLAADQFVSGSNPLPVLSGTGVFLYDTDDGALAWDADGARGNPAVTIAILLNQPALSASDFLIF